MPRNISKYKNRSRDLGILVRHLRAMREDSREETDEYYEKAIEALVLIAQANSHFKRKTPEIRELVERLIRNKYSVRHIVQVAHVAKDYVYFIRKKIGSS